MCPAMLSPLGMLSSAQANVHSIVDHHKLSGLKTCKPLEVDIRSLCSTGSILYARAKAAGMKVPPKIAALMLSCILSDSLEFRRCVACSVLDEPVAAPIAPRVSPLRLRSSTSTLAFAHSPTTTTWDKQFAAELARIAKIDMHAHAEAMLEAKVLSFPR